MLSDFGKLYIMSSCTHTSFPEVAEHMFDKSILLCNKTVDLIKLIYSKVFQVDGYMMERLKCFNLKVCQLNNGVTTQGEFRSQLIN